MIIVFNWSFGDAFALGAKVLTALKCPDQRARVEKAMAAAFSLPAPSFH
jgi:hypothetical protein